MHAQLKNFIQKAKFDPSIDDHYFAKSQENTKDHSDDILSKRIAIYIFTFYIVGFYHSPCNHCVHVDYFLQLQAVGQETEENVYIK